jgi:hypothetical protein
LKELTEKNWKRLRKELKGFFIVDKWNKRIERVDRKELKKLKKSIERIVNKKSEIKQLKELTEKNWKDSWNKSEQKDVLGRNKGRRYS